jgi:hypothetical protein
MKKKFAIAFLMIFLLKFNCLSQTYYPLPTHDAYWTVYEFDEFAGVYDDKIYSVICDTTINGLSYTKVYQLNDYPTIYDTIKKLHCLMRQDSVAKKIWFIRTYLNETKEKLGYDLGATVGDTISLPAFSFPSDGGDSLFEFSSFGANDITIPNGTSRNGYTFNSVIGGLWIGYHEGVSAFRNTFPDRYFFADAFHQCFTTCVFFGKDFQYSPMWINNNNCDFNLVNIRENNIESSNILVYPNPFSDMAEINFKSGIYAKFQLIDILGNIVLSTTIQNYQSNYILQRNNLNSGLYLGKMIGKNNDYATLKIVIY